jgi:hypothetical protein
MTALATLDGVSVTLNEQGTAPPAQLDLFSPPSPLLGVRVVRSDPCPKCRSFTAAIGTGRSPHVASLICAVCHRFVAWLPKVEHDFINSVVTEFGRPTEPIVLRSHSTPTESA